MDESSYLEICQAALLHVCALAVSGDLYYLDYILSGKADEMMTEAGIDKPESKEFFLGELLQRIADQKWMKLPKPTND